MYYTYIHTWSRLMILGTSLLSKVMLDERGYGKLCDMGWPGEPAPAISTTRDCWDGGDGDDTRFLLEKLGVILGARAVFVVILQFFVYPNDPEFLH